MIAMTAHARKHSKCSSYVQTNNLQLYDTPRATNHGISCCCHQDILVFKGVQVLYKRYYASTPSSAISLPPKQDMRMKSAIGKQDNPILHPAGGCLLLLLLLAQLLLLLEALAAVLLLLFRDTLLARRVRLL